MRFRLRKPEDLGKFVAPPYDMLNVATIDELYDRDKYNIVRITQNRPLKKDRANVDRHRRAAALMRSWLEKKVLIRDEEPSVYVYEQKFTHDNKETARTGVVVLVKLADFDKKIILPHESTLNGPKQDRYELLNACRAHTEQIFGLLSDEGGAFYSILRSLAFGEPEGCFTDENGVTHSLFSCSDREIIDKLVSLAEGQTVLIADGHHRYETSLQFYHNNPLPQYSYTMMTLVSTADPGLLIRPFHRLVRKGAGRKIEMRRELSAYFSLEDRGAAEASKIREFIVSDDGEDFLFLDSSDNRIYGCRLNVKGKELLLSVMPERSAMWKELPVSVINIVVVNSIMGLPLDGRVLHDVIDYVYDVDAALRQCANRDDFYGGFFVKPANISTIGNIVAGGERMPQKSTNFFPKVYSGLVLYEMDHR